MDLDDQIEGDRLNGYSDIERGYLDVVGRNSDALPIGRTSYFLLQHLVRIYFQNCFVCMITLKIWIFSRIVEHDIKHTFSYSTVIRFPYSLIN